MQTDNEPLTYYIGDLDIDRPEFFQSLFLNNKSLSYGHEIMSAFGKNDRFKRIDIMLCGLIGVNIVGLEYVERTAVEKKMLIFMIQFFLDELEQWVLSLELSKEALEAYQSYVDALHELINLMPPYHESKTLISRNFLTWRIVELLRFPEKLDEFKTTFADLSVGDDLDEISKIYISPGPRSNYQVIFSPQYLIPLSGSFEIGQKITFKPGIKLRGKSKKLLREDGAYEIIEIEKEKVDIRFY